jgi:molybdopterin-binding protein/molybdate transport repressor ModE-like protein
MAKIPETNRYEGTLLEPGRLRVGRAILVVPAWKKRRGKVSISIRPNDLVVALDHPGRTSARNVLPGHVHSVVRYPDGALVRVDAGFPLWARVTRAAVRELKLRKGTPVYVLLKSMAIGLDEGTSSGDLELEIRARGKRGVVGAERLRFLREIGHLGSIAAAARSFDVTYRTAWLWVARANHDWGTPLVSRVTSGGASLTGEGRRLLERVRKKEQQVRGRV